MVEIYQINHLDNRIWSLFLKPLIWKLDHTKKFPLCLCLNFLSRQEIVYFLHTSGKQELFLHIPCPWLRVAKLIFFFFFPRGGFSIREHLRNMTVLLLLAAVSLEALFVIVPCSSSEELEKCSFSLVGEIPMDIIWTVISSCNVQAPLTSTVLSYSYSFLWLLDLLQVIYLCIPHVLFQWKSFSVFLQCTNTTKWYSWI